MAQYQLVHFNLNGKDVERMVDVRASLTDMLRNDYHMTSVKKGCEVGECGACNVIIDGECFNSCIYLAVWAEGKRVRTLESLMGPSGELSDIQQAFIDETAVQCGFCTPGFIMTAVEILESGKLYTDAELRSMYNSEVSAGTAQGTFEAWKNAGSWRRNASGTDWFPGGRTLLSEHGAETAILPQGTRILTAQETRQSGGDTYNITIDAHTVREFEDILRIVQERRRVVRMGGA